jgi:iron complex transport system ATP-binding protein
MDTAPDPADDVPAQPAATDGPRPSAPGPGDAGNGPAIHGGGTMPGNGPDAVTISGLTVRLRERLVLDGVSLGAPSGSVTALIGPNGAGKSTLIAAVLGLVAVERGTVRLGDADPLAMDRRQRARLIGYVPQRSRLNAPLAVSEVVALGRYALGGGLTGLGAGRAAVHQALTQVDAAHLSTRRFSELSAGEGQRVLVARALAGGARTLLLDEPTAALDIGHALALLELLRRLAAEGRTVLVALHQLEEVRRVADHAVLLHHGRVLASGDPMAVLGAGALAEAFGVEADPAGALGFRLAAGRP